MIHSPCVRQCCLDDNDICIGCYRTLQEICRWQALSDAEKQQVLVQCQQRQAERDHKRFAKPSR